MRENTHTHILSGLKNSQKFLNPGKKKISVVFFFQECFFMDLGETIFSIVKPLLYFPHYLILSSLLCEGDKEMFLNHSSLFYKFSKYSRVPVLKRLMPYQCKLGLEVQDC